LLTLFSAVFQAGGLVVVVVEVFRRNFLASMVPVIVNAVLNEHQLVIDIVSFVLKGDFHRSRLGEKQRGKILAGWVTRKMRTIAQYSIRDPNGPDSQITEVAEPGGMVGRSNTGTFTKTPGPGSVKGSLRGSVHGMATQMQNLQLQTNPQDIPEGQPLNFGFPPGVAEMPAGQSYPESIPERAELALGSARDDDDTPTETRTGFPPQQHLSENSGMPYYDETQMLPQGPGAAAGTSPNHQQYGATGLSTSPLPAALQPGSAHAASDDLSLSGPPPEPHYNNKPYAGVGVGVGVRGPPQDDGGRQQFQNMYLPNAHPNADPNRDMQFGNGAPHPGHHDVGIATAGPDRWEQRWQPEAQGAGGGSGGGLRITNRDSSSTVNGDEEWAQEAIMHMNFAGAGPEEMRRYGG
jgi:hypothetical protein